jgi:hypothetical protein
MLTDTHCHIYRKYYDNIDDIIKESGSKGVNKYINNGCDLETSMEVLELSEKYDSMYAAIKAIVKFVCKILFFVEVKGEENIPKEGAAILAPNHTSFWDAPIILSFTKRKMRTMGKAELF